MPRAWSGSQGRASRPPGGKVPPRSHDLKPAIPREGTILRSRRVARVLWQLPTGFGGGGASADHSRNSAATRNDIGATGLASVASKWRTAGLAPTLSNASATDMCSPTQQSERQPAWLAVHLPRFSIRPGCLPPQHPVHSPIGCNFARSQRVVNPRDCLWKPTAITPTVCLAAAPWYLACRKTQVQRRDPSFVGRDM